MSENWVTGNQNLLITVKNLATAEAQKLGLEISNETILTVAEMMHSYVKEVMAVDLEAFARHAKRLSVTVDDVVLLARRNSDLIKRLINPKASKATVKGKTKVPGKAREKIGTTAEKKARGNEKGIAKKTHKVMLKQYKKE